jgi:hypothetical protein
MKLIRLREESPEGAAYRRDYQAFLPVALSRAVKLTV